MSERKPILCLDFDGVIHSYSSGWKGATVIPDPPVSGAFAFILNAMEHFEVHIYSSRSGQSGGLPAMQNWFEKWAAVDSEGKERSTAWVKKLHWPNSKPSAFLTIDDRALTFTGRWWSAEDLLNFKPWNKQ